MDRYEVLEEIGRNHYATVWEAYDHRLKRQVAVMEFLEKLVRDPRRREQVLCDARSLADIRDRNIVPVHDMIEERGWVVMELMRGHLGAQLARGPMPPQLARSVLRQVLEALRKIHEAGRCHGDVKPANLLYNDEGRVLLSYSPGLFLGGTAPERHQDQKYQAPEMLNADAFGTVGPGVDLYCLGLSILELLKGPRFDDLFKGTGRNAVDAAVAWARWHGDPQQQLPGADQVVPNLPADLALVLDRMLNKQVTDRYQSADEVLADLKETPLQLVDVPAAEPCRPESPRPLREGGVRIEAERFRFENAATPRRPEPVRRPPPSSVPPSQGSAAERAPAKPQVGPAPRPWSREWMNKKLENPLVMAGVIALIVVPTLGYIIGDSLRRTDETQASVPVSIDSIPQGAEVTVLRIDANGEAKMDLPEAAAEAGNSTPSELNLPPGTYRFRLTMPDHEPLTTSEIEVTAREDRMVLSPFELSRVAQPAPPVPSTVAVTIATDPPGAALTVFRLDDSREVQAATEDSESKAPLHTPAELRLRPGAYRFRLALPDHQTFTSPEIQIQDGTDIASIGPFSLSPTGKESPPATRTGPEEADSDAIAEPGPPSPKRPFKQIEQVMTDILTDLQSHEAQDRPYRRYFTLAHLHNNQRVSEHDLTTCRSALESTVGRLARKPTGIVPEAVDQQQTVYSLDLRDWGWDSADWEVVLKAYPYGLKFMNVADERLVELDTQVELLSGTPLAHVRADWLTAISTGPPLPFRLPPLPRSEQHIDTRPPADEQNAKSDREVAELLDAAIGLFRRDLALADAALEVGLEDPGELQAAIHSAPRLKQLGLDVLANGESITRSAWENRTNVVSPFQETARVLKRGTPLVYLGNQEEPAEHPDLRSLIFKNHRDAKVLLCAAQCTALRHVRE